jgi:hypothetical protein
MHKYEGKIIKQANGKFHAVILKNDQPNSDTVMEYEASTVEEASIWVDDQISILITGKGVWE